MMIGVDGVTEDRARRNRASLTFEEVLALPVSVDVVTAGRAFGLSRDTAYDLARAGAFPCPVLRIGNRWVVPRAGILKALGISEDRGRDR